jgi:hypothetical protein
VVIRGHRHAVTIAHPTVRVASGKQRTITFTSSLIRRYPRKLSLVVKTLTGAGSLTQAVRVK